jgi:hypothetical protein
MKRLTLLLILLLFFVPSCTRESPSVDYVWTGQERITHLVPICVIWYKKVPPPLDAWKPHKAFSQADANDMRNIILSLTRPEKKEPNTNLKTKDKLSLIFYNGFPDKLKVREVYFEIKDQTFIGPLGESNNLAKILIEKREIPSGFYYPYKDLGANHYRDSFHRILSVLKSQESFPMNAEGLKPE